MKKQTLSKKLNLSRETLCQLEAEKLNLAIGGATVYTYTGCPSVRTCLETACPNSSCYC